MYTTSLLRTFGLATITLLLGACVSTLKVKPIDVGSDPAAQIRAFKESLDAARQEEVHLFSPTWFARADASASEAAKKRAEGGEIESMLKAVARGKAELEQAKRFTGIARAELGEPYQARKDAIASGAAELYGDEYASGERGFRGLAESIEAENLSRARQNSPDVTQAFRLLETRAIKQHTLGEARRLIEAAKEEGAKRYAPRTLKEAEASLMATDKFITDNPKATRQIQTKAAETLRQATHLSAVLQQVKAWEPLAGEDRVRYVESGLDRFDAIVVKGEAAQPVLPLDKRFTNMLQRTRVLVDNRAFLNSELNRAQEELQKAKVGMKELEVEKEATVRFERVSQMFTPDEAEVYRQGKNVLIRLRGLNFEVGKAYVLTEHYPLLTRVMQAVRIIEPGRIVVEGHTDASGSTAANQVLSLERAVAVKSYLVNNSGLAADRFTAAGYGPDKPLAPHTTSEGRRLNRRIDIILSPH